MRFVRIVASLSALSLGIAGTSVAAESSGQGADTTSSATAQKAYQAIAGVDRKLTEAAADVPASTSGADALKTTQRGVGVTIPTDPRSDVTIAGRNGAVSVTLPFSGSAAKAASSHSGTVTFDNKNSSSTTPIARGDGSTQINTVINDAKAPKRYTYKMKVPQGAKIEQKANSILVTKNGKLVAGIAPAWAKDAKGKSVPTHYEVKGDAVTQVSTTATNSRIPSSPIRGWGRTCSKHWRRTGKASMKAKMSIRACYRLGEWLSILEVASPQI